MRRVKFFYCLLFFYCFFLIKEVGAMPVGTILYKTSENGRMFGYNDFEFSMVPGQIYSGGVAIYIGMGKKTGLPHIVEVDYSGARIIPAQYFVDLNKN